MMTWRSFSTTSWTSCEQCRLNDRLFSFVTCHMSSMPVTQLITWAQHQSHDWSHELSASHTTDHMSSSNSRVYSITIFSIYIHPQGGIGGERIHELTPVHKTTKSVVSETPKDVILTSIDQGKQSVSNFLNKICELTCNCSTSLSLQTAGEIIATLSHIMVPNPTKSTIAETQTRLTDTVAEIQRNLSKLLIMIEQPTSAGRLG